MKKYILPNHIHKRRASLVNRQALFGYVIFFAVFMFMTGGVVKIGEGVLGYATNIKLQDLLNQTNELRQKNNLSPLTINQNLSKAAQAKANDMFEDDYWAHTAPDGTEPWDFIKAYGYEYSYAGENLAVDFTNSKDVVDAWFKSVSHRENLLNANYTEIGFAVVNGELKGRKTTLVVQLFGRPLSGGGPEILASSESPNLENLQTQINPDLNQDLNPLTDKDLTINNVLTNVESSVSQDAANQNAAGRVLNTTDVFNVSKNIAIVLGLFVTVIFGIDGYYVRRHQIFRMTGHTFLHIVMLLFAILAIWYSHIGLVL